MLAFSAPITAAIIRLVPSRKNKNNPGIKYIGREAFEIFQESAQRQLTEIKDEITRIWQALDKLREAVSGGK